MRLSRWVPVGIFIIILCLLPAADSSTTQELRTQVIAMPPHAQEVAVATEEEVGAILHQQDSHKLYEEVKGVLDELCPTFSACLEGLIDKEGRGEAIRSPKYLSRLLGYAMALKASQDSHEDLIQASESLLGIIRTLCSTNLLIPKGKRESFSNGEVPVVKAMWSAHLPRLMTMLEERKRRSAGTDDEEQALYSFFETYMYQAQHRGPAKSVLAGVPVIYHQALDRLDRHYPNYCKGVTNIFRGAFFLVVPWPLYSASRAHQELLLGLEVQPNSCMHNYFCGVSAHALGKYHDAMAFFHKASREDLTTAHLKLEVDMEMVIRLEAARAMELCRSLLV